MAARKLQQEIEKCFKKVHEGVEEFEGIFEKYEQSTNSSQREKLVENLKRECKKLQRLRDQIKTWAASNEVKDKGPLQEKRELIETQMEKFKAVEKEMKTKAFSKEGLQASAKLDPKEREKLEVAQFLSDMVEELGRQIEAIEAETESLLAQTKKSKKDTSKADRVADLEHTTERHKWHQGKLELLLRSLENDSVDSDQVKDQEENIKYYVENNTDVDFIEDDTIYEDFNLDEEEGRFGVHHELDKVSSQDNQSNQEDTPELENRLPNTQASKPKQASVSDVSVSGRRPSQHIKSPLPALATLHTMPPPANGIPANTMKPAPPPTKPVGEPLRYASAAAAAAASDKSGVGVAPLPPPPGSSTHSNPASSTLPATAAAIKSANTSSPSTVHSQITSNSHPIPTRSQDAEPSSNEKAQQDTTALESSNMLDTNPASNYSQPVPAPKEQALNVTQQADHFDGDFEDPKASNVSAGPSNATPESRGREIGNLSALHTNGNQNEMEDDEAILHYLPASLHDLVDSYMSVKNSVTSVSDPEFNRQLEASYANRPTAADVERPIFYKAKHGPYLSPSHYPQQSLPVFDDARLYDRVDPDVLFYSFYYRQGTYQQYLAAKKLKGQSWRFHKQYQTWFQRHEEPKNITEDFEQGTYRFFDYESTWMNRRKADFKFAYKFLEDDL